MVFKNIDHLRDTLVALGGRVFLVGGAIRDEIIGVPNHDRDLMVTGLTAGALEGLGMAMTGDLFPVFRTELEDGEEIEVALARSEKKVGEGHNGFLMDTANISVKEDLLRRDLTINAIARDLSTGEIVDPFGGVDDIRAGKLRAVSAAFSEDPLRTLRVARFAAKLGFVPTPDTIELMHGTREELIHIPHERIGGELLKALAAPHPDMFFRVLADAGVLDVTFPEVAALIGQTQPVEWHPEGDAFAHTLLVLKGVADRTHDPLARFAALAHDLGKGVTPKALLPKHHGHDAAGVGVIDAWMGRAPRLLPVKFWKIARFASRTHMSLPVMRKAGKLVTAILDLEKGGALDAVLHVITVDRNGDIPAWMIHIDDVLTTLHGITGRDAIAAGVTGPAVATWLTNRRALAMRAFL